MNNKNIEKQLSRDSIIEELGLSNSVLVILKTKGYKTIGDICTQDRSKLIVDINNDKYFYALLMCIYEKGFMLDSEIIIYEDLKKRVQEGKKINFGCFRISSNHIFFLDKCFGSLDKLCLLTENGVRNIVNDKNIADEIIFLVKYVGLTFATKKYPKADVTWNLERFIPLISIKTCNILKNIGVYTLENLLNKSEEDLKNILRIGRMTLNEIVLFVHALGYNLKGQLEKKERLLQIRVENPVSLDTPIEKYSSFFSNTLYNNLRRFGVKTLRDLITANPNELIKYRIREKSIQDIEAFVNSLGYSLDEKIEPLDDKDDIHLDKLIEMFGFPLSVNAYNRLRCIGVSTLQDLLSLSLNDLSKDRKMGKDVKQEIINFVHSLGYNLKDESKNTPTVNLQTPLKEFVPKLPSRVCLALKRGGINTLGDLLAKSTSQILEVKYIGEGILQEIINFVHSLGYSFNDEVIYENIINLDEQNLRQLQENNEIASRIASKKSMLAKYGKLIREKQALLERERELDREIALALETLNNLIGEKDVQKVK